MAIRNEYDFLVESAPESQIKGRFVSALIPWRLGLSVSGGSGLRWSISMTSTRRSHLYTMASLIAPGSR